MLHGDLPVGDAVLWGGVIVLACAAIAFARRITFRDVLGIVAVLLILAVLYVAAGAIWAADLVRGKL